MEFFACIGIVFLCCLFINLPGFVRIFREEKLKKGEPEKNARETEIPQPAKEFAPPSVTPWYTYGDHMYRSRGDDPTVYFVNEARGIRKKIVDHNGWIQDFPGIEKEEFWVKEVSSGSLMPQIRFRTEFGRQEDKFIMRWQVQPDGRYWEDEDGFGMTPEEEIVLYTFLDLDGNFTDPFKLYRIGRREYHSLEEK